MTDNSRKTRTNLRGSAAPIGENNGWQIFEARLQRLQLSLDPEHEDVDIEETLPNAIKNKYKNREVSGTLLHFAIDTDSEALQEAEKIGATIAAEDMVMGLVLEAKADVNAWMCFNAFGKEGRVLAIHLAAARGLLPGIKLLVDYAADLNQKSLHDGEPNFCAIHDASFAGNKKSVQCLLEMRADPNVRNKDGKLPIHLTSEVGSDQVAELLIEAKARLDGEIPDQAGTTPINLAVRRRLFREDRIHILAPFCYEDYDVDFFSSMVEICRENVPAAKALVGSILGTNSKAGPGLNDPAAKRRERVVKAVKDGCAKGQSPIPSLMEIIKLAPDVSAAILDIFLVKPRECSFSHPLPKVANLLNEIMYTTYNADFEWKFDGTKSDPTKQFPRWHKALAPPPMGNEDDMEVKVKYLSFPNLLDIRVLHALNHARDKKIFGSITIQAVVRCAWQTADSAVKLNICFECISYAILAWWACVTLDYLPITTRRDLSQCGQWHSHGKVIINGGRLPYTTLPPTHDVLEDDPWELFHHNAAMTAMSVFWAFAYREIFNFCYFVVMQRIWGFSCRLLINNTTFTEAASTALLVCLLTGVGDQILPILSSFRPMSRFFFFAFCIYITFLGAFASMRKAERVERIIETLFFGLLAGDGTSYEALRELDNQGQLSLFLLVVATVTFTVCTLNLMIAIFSKVYKDNAAEATLLFLQHRSHCIEQYLKFPVWSIDCSFFKNYFRKCFSHARHVDATEDSMEENTDPFSPKNETDKVPYILAGVFFVIWLLLDVVNSVVMQEGCVAIWLPVYLAASLVLLQAGLMQNSWFNRDFFKKRLYMLNHRESNTDAGDGAASMTLLHGNSREVHMRNGGSQEYSLAFDASADLLEYEDDFFIWMCHRSDYEQGSKKDELKSLLKELSENVQKLTKNVSDVTTKVDKLQLRMDDAMPVGKKRLSQQGILNKQKSKVIGPTKSCKPGDFAMRNLEKDFEHKASDSSGLPVSVHQTASGSEKDSKRGNESKRSGQRSPSGSPGFASPPPKAHPAPPQYAGFPSPVVRDLEHEPLPPRYAHPSPQSADSKTKHNR